MSKLPSHEIFVLTHNEHRLYHLSVVEHLMDSAYQFLNREHITRTIATGELWSAVWYPSNPNFSIILGAPTLKELMHLVSEYENLKNTLVTSELYSDADENSWE